MTNLSLRQGQSPTAHTISIGPLTLVFSYETVVAFAVSGQGWFISENVWSKTTGKHLNQETPGGVKRIPHDLFEAELDKVMDQVSFHGA